MLKRPGARLLAAPRLRFVRRRRSRRSLFFAIAILPLLDVMASITLVLLGWSSTQPP